MNLIEHRTIALAGVLQACKQVQNLARNGRSDAYDTEPSMQSILVLDAINTPAVYGGINGVNSGLRMLKDGVLSSPQAQDVELLRYVMTVFDLQRQLYRDDAAFAKFGQAVERLSSVSSENFTQECSQVYQQHISDLRPQIIVQVNKIIYNKPRYHHKYVPCCWPRYVPPCCGSKRVVIVLRCCGSGHVCNVRRLHFCNKAITKK